MLSQSIRPPASRDGPSVGASSGETPDSEHDHSGNATGPTSPASASGKPKLRSSSETGVGNLQRWYESVGKGPSHYVPAGRLGRGFSDSPEMMKLEEKHGSMVPAVLDHLKTTSADTADKSSVTDGEDEEEFPDDTTVDPRFTLQSARTEDLSLSQWSTAIEPKNDVLPQWSTAAPRDGGMYVNMTGAARRQSPLLGGSSVQAPLSGHSSSLAPGSVLPPARASDLSEPAMIWDKGLGAVGDRHGRQWSSMPRSHSEQMQSSLRASLSCTTLADHDRSMADRDRLGDIYVRNREGKEVHRQGRDSQDLDIEQLMPPNITNFGRREQTTHHDDDS